MKLLRTFMLMFISLGTLFAVVGDWVSYGSQLTLEDLYVSGKYLRAASHGGLVVFDTENETFSTESNTDYLKHIDILRYFVNKDGSEWYSYTSGVDGISYRFDNGNSDYFDFDFTNAESFAGSERHVLATYMNGLAPEIAHFVKNNNRYVFQDTYNQFPGSPEAIYDIAIVNDSIFIATDKGLKKAWLYNSNLKPENAWSDILLGNTSTPQYLGVWGDSLYLVNEDDDLYTYYHGEENKILESNEPGLGFYNCYYATQHYIYDILTGNIIYHSDNDLSGFAFQGDTLWVSEEDRGLLRILPGGSRQERFIPNTPLYTRANSLAITNDQKIAVCGLGGISILNGKSWHNLVFSPYEEAIHDEYITDQYCADTLNISYRVGGATAVYDALVSSSNELFCSITDISAIPFLDQSAEAKGPGTLQRIELDDLSQYTVYDTSNGVIEGTQGLGGASYYLRMRGLVEDGSGNIWALNIHTLDARPLLKIQPNGNIRKYSVSESGNTLQILAREMVFDKYGRLWIANEARQSDIPRTTGGITVYAPNSGTWALITTADGLASNNVYSIDIDPVTGNIWAATASGVQMIRVPSSFTSETEFIMNSAIDGLSGMIPVKIRIDAIGNKWILTQSQGIQIYMTNNRWFDDGNGLTIANSKLLDNVVYDLVFDSKNGYAYLLTASGLNRYEIAWTEERTSMDDITVFPQPFHPGVDPYLAIDGLAEQSHVRITTLDGRVVCQFAADAEENFEKQIVWDGILPNGEYISRGVYLVFITNIDGLKTTTKFAVE